MSQLAAYDSGAELTALISSGGIKLRRAPLFDQSPQPHDLADLRKNARIEGMLLGVAVGDALGHSTEWKYDAEQRNREYGTILDHVGKTLSLPGRISDDTQLSYWTLETLLDEGGFHLEALVKRFVERRGDVVGMGRNTAASLARHAARLKDGRISLAACAGDPYQEGRGNGSVMRLAPLLLPHLRQPAPALYSDLALAAFVTHGHSAALAATVALGHMLWEMLRRPLHDAPPAEWWLDEFVRIASELEPWPPKYVPGEAPVPALLAGFSGALCDFVDGEVRRAWRRGMTVRDACSLKGFGSGADCFQSVPAVLYVLMHHADSFECAVISAVNDTKDNDTIASIAGAFCGALHGKAAIRRKWLEGISSRSLSTRGNTAALDRDEIIRLAQAARQRFVE